MRYAINETALNGWATYHGRGDVDIAVSGSIGSGFAGLAKLGQGSAQQVVTVTGQGRLIIHGVANASALAITANGAAATVRLGAGANGFQIGVFGTGYARIHGDGSLTAALSATGEGTVIPAAGGRGLLSMLANGAGKVAILASGSAAMSMTGQGRIRTTTPKKGSGALSILGNAYGAGRIDFAANSGAASVVIGAAGTARSPVIHQGHGLAALSLLAGRGADSGWHEVFGSGEAVVVALTARYAIPRRLAVSDVFSPAHPSRVMRVPADRSRMRVPKDVRTM